MRKKKKGHRVLERENLLFMREPPKKKKKKTGRGGGAVDHYPDFGTITNTQREKGSGKQKGKNDHSLKREETQGLWKGGKGDCKKDGVADKAESLWRKKKGKNSKGEKILPRKKRKRREKRPRWGGGQEVERLAKQKREAAVLGLQLGRRCVKNQSLSGFIPKTQNPRRKGQ